MRALTILMLLGALLAGAILAVRSYERAARAGEEVAVASRPGEFAVGGPPPDKVALLVGIDEYPAGDDSIQPLRGCINDVELVKRKLVDDLGFAEENVLVLTNEQATHERFVRAFDEHLIQRAGPETEAFIFYSGHGSQTKDLSGITTAEPDGLDSTYVMYDSRQGDRRGEHDVTDDEMKSFIAALAEKTPYVVVVTDSCHSGGAVRGAERGGSPRLARAGTRSLDPANPGPVGLFFPPDVKFLEDGDPGASPDRYLHIAACGPRQVAKEISVDLLDGSTVTHGAATFYLMLALEQAQPGASWEDVADDAARRLSNEVPTQTIWCEGNRSRELFGSGFRKRKGFKASLFPNGNVSVKAGEVHGLGIGSELSVLDAAGDEIGRATIEGIAYNMSRAPWSTPRPDPLPDGPLRVVEVGTRGGRPPLRVFAGDEDLAGHLAAARDAKPASSLDAAAYTLDLEGDQLVFATLEGLRIWSGPPVDEGLPAGLLEWLEREMTREFLNGLPTDHRGGLALEVAFRSPTAEERRDRPASEVRTLAEAGHGAAAGSQVLATGGSREEFRIAMLDITNPHDETVFVYVLSVPDDRSGIFRVWPEPGDVELGPGESALASVGIVAPQDWPFERPMRDRYIVYASRHRLDLSAFVYDRDKEKSTTRGAEAAPGPAPERANYGIIATDLLVTAEPSE